MKWTAICVNLDGETSFVFYFVASHSKRMLSSTLRTDII